MIECLFIYFRLCALCIGWLICIKKRRVKEIEGIFLDFGAENPGDEQNQWFFPVFSFRNIPCTKNRQTKNTQSEEENVFFLLFYLWKTQHGIIGLNNFKSTEFNWKTADFLFFQKKKLSQTYGAHHRQLDIGIWETKFYINDMADHQTYTYTHKSDFKLDFRKQK